MAEASRAVFACPGCGQTLGGPVAGQRIVCTRCGLGFPLLVTGIPVLVHPGDPDERCTAAARGLYHQLDASDLLASTLAGQLAAGARRPQALRRVERAATLQSTFIRRLLGALDHTWPVAKAGPAGLRAASIAEELDLAYFVRDWSHAASAEASIATVMASVARQLAASSARDTAVVLGAGAGRFAWELTSIFAQVVAVEWSIASALAWAVLGRGALDLCELEAQNVASVDDICAPIRCSLEPDGAPPDPARLARLAWLVADARRTPLAAGSASAVVSIYFTDRVSPPRSSPRPTGCSRPAASSCISDRSAIATPTSTT